ncbi:SufE family protein [Meiothermus sp. QL-1]|uniref:SufE family protein n=1 Tax=Meiothermus sp. QL-1 TaxID=2058095 RepID=UPI000E0C13A5|nr:SufE family protein [Meiothermus sp. QL-1]RDI94928.1 SufE family protein [Meiothermus sp. QL-1]
MSEERLALLPPRLKSALQTLGSAPKALKIELLLEFARKMPPLPEGMQGRLEQVHECTTPFFVHAEIKDQRVHLYFDAPKEAPTVRAFAGLLAEGLEGESPEAVLAVPEDFYTLARLEEIITPLRLRGLQAVLTRIKRQVREAQN